MRRALVLCVVVASSSCALKPYHRALTPTANVVPTKELVYPTGLRVVAEQHAGSKRVAIALLVGAGAANDLPGREGTAHFVEHLVFRSRPGKFLQLWDELDVAGIAAGNAHTTLDATWFVGVVAAERANEVLPLFASMVTAPLVGVEPATIEIERSVVRNEYLMRFPHGGGAYLAKLGELAFGKDAPPARPISGSPESLAAITRADLESFVKMNYQPRAVTLVLVGDLRPDEVDAMVRKSFPAEWLDAPSGSSGFARAAPLTHGVIARALPPRALQWPTLEVGVTQPQLVFVWQVPGPGAAADDVMPLVAHAFAEHVARSTHRAVRGQFLPGLFGSMLTLSIKPFPNEDLSVLAAKVRGVRDVRLDIPPEVLARSGLARFASQQNLLVHAESRAHASWRSIDAADPSRLSSELERLRGAVLTWENARELMLMPQPLEFETTEIPERAESGPRVMVDPARLAEVALPAALPEVQTFTLPNGLRVVLSRRLPVPVATVTLALPIGTRHTTQLTPEVLGVLLDWNGQHRSDFALVSKPKVTIEPDVTTVTLTGEAHLLPVMLDVFGHNLGPTVSKGRVRGLDKYLSRLRLLRGMRREPDHDDDDDEEDSKKLRELVLPPAHSVMPLDVLDTTKVDATQFERFVDDAFQPRGAVLFVDGDLELASTRKIVEELFSSWNAGSRALPPLRDTGEKPRKPKKVRRIEVRDATQTTVRLMCRLPPVKTLEQRGGMVLLGEALATTFEEDLRRARGLTYGVTAAVSEWSSDDNILLLTTNLDARAGQHALGQFLDRLASLEGVAWEPRVVDLARWRLAKRHLASQTSKSVSTTLAEEMVRGLSLEEAAGLPMRLATVPLSSVDDAWRACVDTLAIEVRGQRVSVDRVLKARGR